MQKVKPGDPLRIPAATFNTMIDAAADYRRRAQSGGRPRGRDARPSDLVQVKNYTGQNCPRFGVMDAGGPLFWQVWDPAQEVAFKREVALGGHDASWAAEGRLLVAAEPIGTNKIGWCMATGLIQVRVNVTDPVHRGVRKVQSDITRLHSCPDSMSTAAVVWIESWTVGEHWAIIHVGARPALGGLQHGWATSNWHKAGDGDYDAYVDVRPCNRQATSISTHPVRVYFPLRPFCDPNVELANVIQFEYDRDGDAIARSGYDAAIGTIRPTNVDSPFLIQGWSGLTMDDGEVLAAGNIAQHTGPTAQTHTHDDHVIPSHGHPVQTTTINYTPGSTPQQVVTAVNAANGQTLPHNDVDARPRRYGVRFYIRIDNSAAP